MAQSLLCKRQQDHKAVRPPIPQEVVIRQAAVLPQEAVPHREAAASHQALPEAHLPDQIRRKIVQIQFRVAVQDQIRLDKNSLKKKERKK